MGTPLTPAELAAATDDLIALLRDTRYFDVVDERVHGWPRTDPAGGYWYGTWWSGVSVEKRGGQVTYRHSSDGADNNGQRTGPFLEGACWAHLLWARPPAASLVRRMVRGFTSWSLAMERTAADPGPSMLARASYLPAVDSTEGGRALRIDTSADLPGVDNAATVYVHLPANPTFGDLWIKNQRSKDDLGEMMRALVQVQACAPRLDAEAQGDIEEMLARYRAFALQVDADAWGIRTRAKDGSDYMPPLLTESLAHYVPQVECPGVLAIRLLGQGAPGSVSCGSGFASSDELAITKASNDVNQILRAHHQAAVLLALWRGQDAVALDLLHGLAARLEADLAWAELSPGAANVVPSDLGALIAHAATVGVPLTSREVRWLHARLRLASAGYRAPALAPAYHVFDAATPDGNYPFEPAADGLFFGEIGGLLGICASPWRNPQGRPVFDCARLAAAF